MQKYDANIAIAFRRKNPEVFIANNKITTRNPKTEKLY